MVIHHETRRKTGTQPAGIERKSSDERGPGRGLRDHTVLDAIVSQMEEGVVIIDENRVVRHFSQSAGRMLEIKSGEVLSKGVEVLQAALGAKIDNAVTFDVLRRLARVSHRPFTARIKYGPPDCRHDIQAKVFLIGDSAKEPSIGIILQEPSEADQIASARDDFVSMVAHELRNPLSVIIGGLRTLLSERDRLTKHESTQLVLDSIREAEAMAEMVGNFLDLTRSERHRLSLSRSVIDVVEVLEKMTRKMRDMHPGRQFNIKRANFSTIVNVDQLRIERILYNLLDNAARYSPPGSPVDCFVDTRKGELIVGIADKGPGISPEDQKKLFRPFQRLGQEHEGIGIGLVVCRQLVEAHGGRIWVKSHPGHGSTFCFSIPKEFLPLAKR